MRREDFDPEDHDPDDTVEIDVTITVEMYEFEADGWIEARWYVVRNSLTDYYTVTNDVDQLGKFWIDIAIPLKEKARDLWQR